MTSALSTSLSSRHGLTHSKQDSKSQEKTQSTKHFVNPAKNETVERTSDDQLELPFDGPDRD